MLIFSKQIPSERVDTRLMGAGKPLQVWDKDSRAAYDALGCPTGTIMLRHVERGDDAPAGTHDGIRDGAAAHIRWYEEVFIA